MVCVFCLLPFIIIIFLKLFVSRCAAKLMLLYSWGDIRFFLRILSQFVTGIEIITQTDWPQSWMQDNLLSRHFVGPHCSIAAAVIPNPIRSNGFCQSPCPINSNPVSHV
eukprot:EG_transcript_39680